MQTATTTATATHDEYLAVIGGRTMARRSVESLTTDVDLAIAEAGAAMAARLADRDLELVELWGTGWVLSGVDDDGRRELLGVYDDEAAGAMALAALAAPALWSVRVDYPSQAVAVAWIQLPNGEVEIVKSVRERYVVRHHPQTEDGPLHLAADFAGAVAWVFGPNGPAVIH